MLNNTYERTNYIQEILSKQITSKKLQLKHYNFTNKKKMEELQTLKEEARIMIAIVTKLVKE